MKIILLLLLPLAALLPGSPAFAAPVQTGPHIAGELARDRLQGMDSLLLSSNEISVAQPGQAGTPLAPDQAKLVSACLSSLVLDDALYVEDGECDRNGISETLTVGKFGQAVTVSIRWDKPYMTIMRFDGNRMVIANYLPILPKVVRLLQAADPNNHSLNAFHPLPSPLPVAKGIPASALTRIATIKPGMERADVLHVFTTEGGAYSSFRRQYVYRDYGLSPIGLRDGLVVVNDKLLKVNVDFAPRDADIVWLNKRGFWLHQSEYQRRSKPAGFDEQADDIILRVSPPYLQYMVTD